MELPEIISIVLPFTFLAKYPTPSARNPFSNYYNSIELYYHTKACNGNVFDFFLYCMKSLTVLVEYKHYSYLKSRSVF